MSSVRIAVRVASSRIGAEHRPRTAFAVVVPPNVHPCGRTA